MKDLIERQAAIDAVLGACKDTATTECAVRELEELPSTQPDVTDTNVGGINKFIDGLVEIFADVRERHVDDSVCGLCEFDGAYIGESGDWYNECPGFDRDDCFKLRDEIRKKWIAEITACMPSAQPERKRGYWINLDSDEENYDDIRCSNCGMNFTVDAHGWCDIGFTVDDLKFCPNCGARMGEGGE